MKIAVFSDTHTAHWQIKVPDADILIFAGDMTHCRTDQEVADFNVFLGTLPHTYKIVVAGNHDCMLTRDPENAKALLSEALYLEDAAKRPLLLISLDLVGISPELSDQICS